MIYAYDKTMLANAQNLLGRMLDFAIYGLDYDADTYYRAFIDSRYSRRIERGDAGTIMGMSGIELAYEVTGESNISEAALEEYTIHSFSRSEEYWAGWSLAYFQWETSLSFREINGINDIKSVVQMYMPYHEMDITHFSDRMKAIYHEKYTDSRLKAARKNCGISQRELAEATGIPLKTIQQYEQRQKNINNAKVDYLIMLSRELHCDIEMLIEKV